MSRNSMTAFALALLCACGPGNPESAAPGERPDSRLLADLDAGLTAVSSASARHDSILQPLPLLTTGQEATLRQFLNAAQLERARALGVDRPDSARIAAELASGGLVPLEKDSPYWVVAGLDQSSAVVTRDAHAMLEEVGRRFQERLANLRLPPYRFEISSALRSAESQARLRQVNPNAAAGVSTHEFGTTVDVLYSRFGAPLDLSEWLPADSDPRLTGRLDAIARTAAERIGGRRALELKAILGEVLIEMQSERRVMVTLERLQPVFHMTVARRY